MIVAGDRSRCYGLENLQRTAISLGRRPVTMPHLPEGHHLLAIYDRLFGERVAICETVEDVQQLWDAYDRGALVALTFYSTNDEVGYIEAITIPGREQS